MLNNAVNTCPVDALILPMTGNLDAAIALSAKLRGAGLKAQLYTEKKKFKAKMSYADKLKVPFVLFLGEDELNEGVVACKNMVTGEQVKLTDDALIRLLAENAEKQAQTASVLDI